ncbi:MAG: HXXEE domain-containing protein [Thermoanaerobaculia bacterium]
MTSQAAPRIVLLLPIAVFVHQVEEWFGGFVPWVDEVVGYSITPEQFLAVNAVGLLLFTGGILAAASAPGAIWLAGAVAALAGVNGVAHIVASLVFGSYSPGAPGRRQQGSHLAGGRPGPSQRPANRTGHQASPRLAANVAQSQARAWAS